MKRISAVLLTLLVALGCASVAEAHRYPTAFTSSFVRSCVKSGGTHATCECTLHYIEARMPYRKFLGQAVRYEKGGAVPPIEKRAVHACV